MWFVSVLNQAIRNGIEKRCWLKKSCEGGKILRRNADVDWGTEWCRTSNVKCPVLSNIHWSMVLHLLCLCLFCFSPYIQQNLRWTSVCLQDARKLGQAAFWFQAPLVWSTQKWTDEIRIEQVRCRWSNVLKNRTDLVGTWAQLHLQPKPRTPCSKVFSDKMNIASRPWWRVMIWASISPWDGGSRLFLSVFELHC